MYSDTQTLIENKKQYYLKDVFNSALCQCGRKLTFINQIKDACYMADCINCGREHTFDISNLKVKINIRRDDT